MTENENGAPLPGEVDEQPAPAKAEGFAEELPGDLLEFCDGEFGSAAQLYIKRLDPHWCSGYLETVPLDGPVTLQEIKDNWGGKRFQIRLLTSRGQYIRAYNVRIDGPPKRNGRLITPESEYEFKQGNPEAIRFYEQPRPAPDNSMNEVLGFFKAQTVSQQALINDLFMRALQPQAAGNGNGVGTIQQARDLIAFAKELQLGGADGAADDGNTKILGTLVEAFLNRNKGGESPPQPNRGPAPPFPVQRPPQLPPRLNQPPGPPMSAPPGPPPVQRVPVPGPMAAPGPMPEYDPEHRTTPVNAVPPPVQVPAAEPAPVPPTPAQVEDLGNLAGRLSALSAEDAAALMSHVMDSWPAEKTDRVADLLFGPETDEDGPEKEGVDKNSEPVSQSSHASGGGKTH